MSNSAELPSQEDAWTIRKEERRKQKEDKDKKARKEKKDAQADSESHKKRKREPLPEEIEIDVKLPEPASKKEARKAKKLKSAPKTSTEDLAQPSTEAKATSEKNGGGQKGGQRSDYGVWIGNLPWSATKETLRTFLAENSDITDEQITRVNMPAPTKPPNPRWTTKPLNKGFAYVDFSTQLAMYSAIALTETKMDGRPLLIKNAKSFEGRPEKPKTEEGGEVVKNGKAGNPPNIRVFVGNLAFDVTKDDLQQHFEQCGEVADIHMATFEDSGKCKGYAWVTFETVDAATSAVKGYIFKEEIKKDANSSEEEGAKKSKKRKWLINKLMGRDLRCEFAEDSTTRYNKRYGKEKKADMDGVHPDRVQHFDDDGASQRPRRQNQTRQDRPRGKVDPRTIKSGAAHANAPRAPQGIVKSEGTKITFD